MRIVVSVICMPPQVPSYQGSCNFYHRARTVPVASFTSQCTHYSCIHNSHCALQVHLEYTSRVPFFLVPMPRCPSHAAIASPLAFFLVPMPRCPSHAAIASPLASPNANSSLVPCCNHFILSGKYLPDTLAFPFQRSFPFSHPIPSIPKTDTNPQIDLS
jgi:hypothetical protein